MNLILQRTSHATDCTQGTLQLPAGSVLHTLELPWIPNPGAPGGEPNVSCVPAGTYQLERHNTLKHPKSFALVNPELGVIHEPDPDYPQARVACLIHVANRVRDLEGCIGVGLECTTGCIMKSRSALTQLQAQLPWENGHTLEIRDPPPAA